MEKLHNLSLLVYDTTKTKKNAGPYVLFQIFLLFFLVQIMLVFTLFVDSWGWKKALQIGAILVAFELCYLFLFLLIKKKLSKNFIAASFFQSIFMNIGIFVNLYVIIAPFILYAYMSNLKIFYYYVLGMLCVCVLALFFVIPLNCNRIIDNTLKNKNKDGCEIIMFYPENVFWPLNKFALIVWIPYVIGAFFMFYGFVLRSGFESKYYLTSGALIYSAILFYSEFCYFWVWVKYRLTNRNNQDLVG